MSKVIDSFSGEYRFLSNFYPAEVEFDGEIYQSVEHAYQAAKTYDEYERTAIKTSKTPAMAKKLGKHVTLRDDWEDAKLQVMTELVYQKFQRHSVLREKLLLTKHIKLVEGNWWGDCYWGVCNGIGENNLGKILMAIRESFKEETNEYCTP